MADMPSFTSQDRPKKVKEIYRALKRDHPEYPPELKARIAARKGKKSPQARKPPETGGPPYKAPITNRHQEKQAMSDLRKQVATNFTKTAFAGTGAVMPMMYGSGGGGMGGGMGYAKGGLVIPKTSKNLAKRLAGKKGAEARKEREKKAYYAKGGLFVPKKAKGLIKKLDKKKSVK